MIIGQTVDELAAHRGTYSTLYADVPWRYVTYSEKGKGRSAERHYNCMSIPEIKAMPIAHLLAKDCVLLFWVTDPFLRIGMDIIEAWGFKYKTVGFTWGKLNKVSPGFFTGMGHWTRSNPEQVLLATRGKPKRLYRDVEQLVISRRREHSRKPDEMYEKIERLVPGPYLELFGRTERDDWNCWGNEVGKFSASTRGLEPATAAE